MIGTLEVVRQETSEASTFVFRLSDPIVYKAGQHVSVMIPIDQPDSRGTVRTFTLSSSPTEQFLAFTTKKGPSSFKKTLSSLPIGASFQVRVPSGAMVLAEGDVRPRVMIAGGIGITPFRSMIKWAFDTKHTVPLTLLYSNTSPEEIVFKKELDEICSSQPAINVIHTITRPEVSRTPWSGRVGRVDKELLQEVAGDLTQTLFLIAGPEAMVTGMVDLLGSMGVDPKHIMFEKFSGY